MNWYKRISRLKKTAGYDYADSLSSQIRQLIPIVRGYVGKVDGAEAILNSLDGSLRSMFNSMGQGENNTAALASGVSALRNANQWMSKYELYSQMGGNGLQEQVQQSVTVGDHWRGFLQGNRKAIASKFELVDMPGSDVQWIHIKGLRLYDVKNGQVLDNPTSQWVQEQMGEGMSVQNDGVNADVYIRGTKESWEKFRSLSRWIFSNDKELGSVRLKLPSETEINPGYQKEQTDELGDKEYHIEVIPLNVGDSEKSYEVGNFQNKPPRGIRLIMPTDHPLFRDHFPRIYEMVRENELFDPRRIRPNWEQGSFDIFEFDKRGTTVEHIERLHSINSIGEALRAWGYKGTAALHNIVKEWGGYNKRELREKVQENETKNIPEEKIQERIRQNVSAEGSDISSRFDESMQQLGIDRNQPIGEKEVFRLASHVYSGNVSDPSAPYGPQNWPGPFDENHTTPTQREQQSKGMWFVNSRAASIIADQPGSGKCLSDDSLCQVNGNIYRMDEIWEKYAGSKIGIDGGDFYSTTGNVQVASIDARGNSIVGKVSAIYRERYAGKMREIKTSSGRKITTTYQHKFLTPDGWSNNITEGDIVCSTSTTPYKGRVEQKAALYELLAWQIGEGDEAKSTGQFRIHQKDISILNNLKSLYDSLGFSVSSVVENKNRCSMLRACSIDYRRFLEKNGYVWGLKARDKVVPEFVMKSKTDLVRVFLKSIFDAEGYSNKNKRSIGLTSASRKLIMQISCLLGRFGIMHTFHDKIKWAANTKEKIKRPYYEITVIGSGLDIFMSEIGFGYSYKKDAYNSITSYRNHNEEGKPVNDILYPLVKKYGITFNHLGITNQKYLNGSLGANNSKIQSIIDHLERISSGETLRRYLEKPKNRWTNSTVIAYESIELADIRDAIDNLYILMNNDLQYEKVMSVKEVDYDGYIYDLTVEDCHNFVAEGGLVCHNTAQAIVGADMTREEGQKILVISPNMLVEENWVGPKAKGPMFFCGHDKSQVAEVADAASLGQAVANPNIIWVVIKMSKFKQSNRQTQEFTQAIKNYSNQGVFSSLIMDEIQMVKNPKSITSKKIEDAIGRVDIPHRIGLTGTPADNKPDDIFQQMVFMSHPIMFRYGNKGNAGRSIGLQTKRPEAFAEMYLGGSQVSKDVNLTTEEKELPIDQQEDIRAEKWGRNAYSVLTWAKNLDPERKNTIMDLFSTTYLRRNKEDIKPELLETAPLTVSANVVEPPEGVEFPDRGQNWHNEALRQMADAKAPMTAAKAVQDLQADPSQHIFIVTKHPDVAIKIADNINAAMGGEVAQAVHGKIKPEDRPAIADNFRNTESGIRAVVYTMQLGAVGLNFANANKAIFNDMDWNPSNNLQAEYRVHRIDSQRPVNVEYTVLGGTYDEEMYNRVEKKKGINEIISNLIRKAASITDPQEKMEAANQLIKNLVDNILLDVGLSGKVQDWFSENLISAMQGGEIEDYDAALRRINKAESPLDAIIPDWVAEDEDPNEAVIWKSQTAKKLDQVLGDKWKTMQPEELQSVLDKLEAERIEKIRNKGVKAPVVPTGPARAKAKPRAAHNWYSRSRLRYGN